MHEPACILASCVYVLVLILCTYALEYKTLLLLWSQVAALQPGQYFLSMNLYFSFSNATTTISTCNPNPCLNGGLCARVNGVLKRIRPTGYTGNICLTQTSELTVGLNKNILARGLVLWASSWINRSWNRGTYTQYYFSENQDGVSLRSQEPSWWRLHPVLQSMQHAPYR